ncbi:STAS domain-containing protein, partial [Streptomyces sp. MMCC 100]|uniref:STAS domain-containing protein n=1 Tax=Streptomyces sp. MMCC 100 TaxID=3163555 RepID=UPI00359B6846
RRLPVRQSPRSFRRLESRGPGGVTSSLQQAMASIADYPTVILDLSGVTFCDSSGFNALLRLRRRALEARSGLVLAARLLRWDASWPSLAPAPSSPCTTASRKPGRKKTGTAKAFDSPGAQHAASSMVSAVAE